MKKLDRLEPEEAAKANSEALALVEKIGRLDLLQAAAYLRRHPPSAEAIAGLIRYIAPRLSRALEARRKRGIPGRPRGRPRKVPKEPE